MPPAREGREFIATLSKQLVVRSYVAHERLPIGQLYVLRRGLVVKLWRFLGSGKVWGEDMILDTPELVDHSQVTPRWDPTPWVTPPTGTPLAPR